MLLAGVASGVRRTLCGVVLWEAACRSSSHTIAAGSDDPNAFRYVLSRAQEDEIREAYLRPKLDVCSVVRTGVMWIEDGRPAHDVCDRSSNQKT